MLDLVLSICRREFTFENYEKCREFFKNLINQLKQMNYNEFKSEKFNSYREGLDKMLA